jgi:hypothetical protein
MLIAARLLKTGDSKQDCIIKNDSMTLSQRRIRFLAPARVLPGLSVRDQITTSLLFANPASGPGTYANILPYINSCEQPKNPDPNVSLDGCIRAHGGFLR